MAVNIYVPVPVWYNLTSGTRRLFCTQAIKIAPGNERQGLKTFLRYLKHALSSNGALNNYLEIKKATTCTISYLLQRAELFRQNSLLRTHIHRTVASGLTVMDPHQAPEPAVSSSSPCSGAFLAVFLYPSNTALCIAKPGVREVLCKHLPHSFRWLHALNVHSCPSAPHVQALLHNTLLDRSI